MGPQTPSGKLEGLFPGLLESGQYSDLEVHCGGEVFKVHKAIVCPQSDFFRLAVKPENGFQEATSGVITLHDADRDVIKTVIMYLYYGNYPAETQLRGKAPFVHIMHHVKVYEAAEMYQMSGLKTQALENLSFLTRFGLWANSVKGDDFVHFIEAVYDATPVPSDQLRAFVLGKVAKDFDALRAGKGLPKALHENPQFAEDLLITLNEQRMADQKLMSDLVPRLHVECSACKDDFDPKLKDVLRVGDLRCDLCDAERESLVWSLPETRGDEQ
ncbi:BTB/POZ protein [Phyllosticta capitalensis]|uniref:BTB/POZ protein n=1 Tax=Phyllosticta capitalensis TaxID=121624 RepID=A0ABR1YIW6_9PEZI